MLPFLQKHKQQGVSMQVRKPDGEGIEHEEGKDEGLHAAAEDLCNALKSGDISRIASALRAAFEILDSEPDEEEKESSNSYDAQNQKAGEERE